MAVLAAGTLWNVTVLTKPALFAFTLVVVLALAVHALGTDWNVACKSSEALMADTYIRCNTDSIMARTTNGLVAMASKPSGETTSRDG